MGKKQHQKDKLYLTTKEWKESFGGHKDDTATRIQKAVFKRLPLDHCALSLNPFEHPVCGDDGIIFDLTQITAYLKKHGVSPCTGKKMKASELIPLKFAKDKEGKFCCPVTFRTFTQTSHIVAIKTTGNVFSKEAIDELNLKRNHLRDLLTDVPFQRKDIITIQDPNHLEKFNMEQFNHVKLDLKTSAQIKAEKLQRENPKFFIRFINNEAKEALAQLEREYIPAKKEEKPELIGDVVNSAHYSQGRMAAGFTSTACDVVTKNRAAVLDEDVVRYARVKRNGYVRIITNHGVLNLELYAKQVPKACENFITHCKNGFFDNTKFHRIIKHFMMQGGDPTGTGKGGESIWGKAFKDEIVGTYKHDKRGVLSMANSGSDTNKSQFFITFRPVKRLDGKHTIFGHVVGGMETLAEIEQVETDGNDRPKDPVLFLAAQIFVDPFEEAQAQVDKERKEARDKEMKISGASSSSDSVLQKPKEYSSGVGKYINPETFGKNSAKRGMEDPLYIGNDAPKKKVLKSQFKMNDFSAW
ncbi:hypothetical protein QR680_016486 [Steinernema hermaphroditum]|uniref:RING-type E3 ubiquitin-protein ligase PPIL2 n=1 Tax=Steinernema hermaphroditum TaxID=289476 RepID=A0AA39HBQ2_9BILA|nr:hypothetical protein QR680_016486 [Steinernema hermaphroditum]